MSTATLAPGGLAGPARAAAGTGRGGPESRGSRPCGEPKNRGIGLPLPAVDGRHHSSGQGGSPPPHTAAFTLARMAATSQHGAGPSRRAATGDGGLLLFRVGGVPVLLAPSWWIGSAIIV